MIKSMLHMGTILRSKFQSSFRIMDGKHGREDVNNLMVRTHVNEEFKEAFRSKSYTDIHNKIQGQLERRISSSEGQSLSSTMASPPYYHHTERVHLLEYLVEPRQQTLISTSDQSSKLHDQFPENYFDTSLEAGKICEFILQNIYQVRANYHSIKNVIKLIDRSPDYTRWSPEQYNWLLRDLASFSLYNNPFSTLTPKTFHELHDSHIQLLHQLTSQYRNTKRRTRLVRCIKRAILTMEYLCGGKQEWKEKQVKDEQFDIAARGVYTVMREFDIMKQMVKVLQEEMEHNKSVAQLCVAEISGKTGKTEITLQRVVWEFQMGAYSCFQKQLEELEQQIYLSFIDINRSRKLLLQEIDKYHDV